MSTMSLKDSVRRAQLVTPFGVGSLIVSTTGTSLLVCSLDEWFSGGFGDTDIEEFKVREPRLERFLRVSHFRLPPDYRKRPQFSANPVPNLLLQVPTVRFPLSHYCPSCGQMDLEVSPYKDSDVYCIAEQCSKRRQRMVQMRFIGVCQQCHLMDIPWRKWLDCQEVTCEQKRLVFTEKGGGTLGDAQVRCGCGKEAKSLSELLTSDTEGEKSTGLKCTSGQPWRSDNRDTPNCTADLRLTLRNANNVYYAQVESALFISKEEVVPRILDIIDGRESNKRIFETLASLIGDRELAERLREVILSLEPFSVADVAEAIAVRKGTKVAPGTEGEYSEDTMRREEFDVLLDERDEENLKIRVPDITQYRLPKLSLSDWFSLISLVERVRETRVLAGFHRLKSDEKRTREQLRAMLWRQSPPRDKQWLPCSVVYGEGIFLRFRDEALAAWENQSEVTKRAEILLRSHMRAVQRGFAKPRPLSARFVLVHTFAHLLMNRLTFACGYSSASLRERLYVSRPGDPPMNGLLIYTAAGDSEGTLGGLVAMGGRDTLPALVKEALDEAAWCSADPVCRESRGQGPESCNLAACHSCSLVPETACEEFNRYLDRELVVGDDGIGFLGPE